MMGVIRTFVALGALALLGALSRMPFPAQNDDHALLRLSWRVRGEPVQQCRQRTPDELAALPAHMRTPQVCSGRVSNYRLLRSIDGRAMPPIELRAAGAHADRPIYVFDELPLTPGAHTVNIEFFSVLHPDGKRVRFQRRVQAHTRDILLITYDAERGELFLRRETNDK